MTNRLTEGKTRAAVKTQQGELRPVSPPPAPRHRMTENKTQELIGKGMRVEGNLLRHKERDDFALVYMGRVVWLSQEELDIILSPDTQITAQYDDEEN